MKIAKYVVIGQVALSAILLVVFMTKSGATPPQGKPRSKAQLAAELEVTKDREESPELGEWSEELPDGKGKHKKGDAHGAKDSGKDSKEAKEPKETKEAKASAHDEHGGGEHGEEAPAPRKPASREKEAKASAEPALAKPVPLPSDPRSVAQVLLAGNQRFADGNRSNFNLVQQRQTAAGGQHPGVMVLGCADSRVPPELIFDRGVGEMFVVRSAGNIAEPVAVGSLEYAAEHLHAKVLLVLGHEKCGAVQAALSEAKMPSVNLEAVVANILPAVKELKAWAEGDALMHMAVEANVRRQTEEVLRKSPLLQKAVTRKELTVLKAVYDLETGQVHPL